MRTGHRTSSAVTTWSARCRRWAPGLVLVPLLLAQACGSGSQPPQVVTNADAGLTYQVGSTWKPAHVVLPFAEGAGTWSGVAQFDAYQCGGDAVSRAMVGGAPYPLPTSEDAALSIAANSLLISVLGVQPPARLPAPTSATVGGVQVRRLEVVVSPNRPGCGNTSTVLDVQAVPSAGGIPGKGAFALFFLAADRDGGPSDVAPLDDAQRRQVLDSVRPS